MIEFLDKKMQREHFENLRLKNPEKLSESQKDFLLLNKIREEIQAGLED